MLKRVAYIFTPIEFGGAEKVTSTFLRHVDRSGFKISPIVIHRPWEEEQFYIKELRSWGYDILKVPVAKPSYATTHRDYLRVPRCFKIIYSLLKKNNFDLIHAHGYLADIIAIPLARILGVPIISTCHGFIGLDKKVGFYNTADRFMLRFAQRVIAVSEEIKDDLVSRGVGELKVRVIKNCVAPTHNSGEMTETRSAVRKKLGVKKNDLLLGYTGRLSEEKGLVFFIEALAMLKGKIPAKALIIGDGPKMESLSKLAGDKGVDVIFTGFQKEVEDYLTAMDVFVLPSLSEGTPMSLLEALSSGLPVVASRVGGIPDVIDDGRTGFLVDPENPAQLCATIQKLFSSPGLRKEVGEKAARYIRDEYDVNAWCKKIVSEYESLTSPSIGLRENEGRAAG